MRLGKTVLRQVPTHVYASAEEAYAHLQPVEIVPLP